MIRLIMKCVAIVKYLVLVNGRPRQCITPSKGLRQGNPLSPYLFLICVEGLSSMISLVEERGDEIKGIAVAREDRELIIFFFCGCLNSFWEGINGGVEKDTRTTQPI